MSRYDAVRRSEWTGGDFDLTPAGMLDLPASRHAHRLPGVWDEDNGPRAGQVCATCWEADRPVALSALLAARWAYEQRMAS